MRRQRLSGTIGLVLAIIASSYPTAAIAYQVKQGDTLWTIAARHHTTTAKLARANHLRENATLSLGKALIVPGQVAKAQPNRASAPTRQACYTVHARVNDLCLRSQPTTGSPKVAALPQGTTMKLVARDGKWAKVALANGTCGFVYRPLLAAGAGQVVAASRPAAEPAQQVASAELDRGGSDLIETALSCRGTHYVRGGTSRGGFDCSGFTRYVFAKYGIALPHSSAAQAGHGTAVSREDLKAGDLVFFQTYRRGISHVGIYIGSGQFVHAASRGRGVTVDSLSSAYYAPRYRGARRVD